MVNDIMQVKLGIQITRSRKKSKHTQLRTHNMVQAYTGTDKIITIRANKAIFLTL